MYNTYDVHFNASWALVQLWPRIEMAMLYDLADITASQDTSSIVFMYKGIKGPRNACLSVPHDLGDPEGEPWVNVNAYIMYPTDHWKDLPSKFVLMAWRDWKLTKDTAFLQYVLPITLVSNTSTISTTQGCLFYRLFLSFYCSLSLRIVWRNGTMMAMELLKMRDSLIKPTTCGSLKD